MSQSETHTPNIHSFEVIMDYFEKKLAEDLVQKIEETIDSNDEYADWVDELHDAWLKNPNYRVDVLQFHQTLFKQMNQEAHPEPQTHWLRRWSPYLLVAASVIALLIFFLNPDATPTPPCDLDDVRMTARKAGIYEQQYITFSAKGTEPIVEAFRLYDEEKYTEAIERFLQHLDTTTQDQKAREGTLCLAVSYFMAGQNTLAASYFQVVEGYFEPKYKIEARWYQALMDLEAGNTADAKIKLQAMANENNPYQMAARALLTCLK
ncbi:MAG: hypothetical protein AAFR59_14820 [Bacteroidota bacterium]